MMIGIVPRYQRRMREVNEAVIATYLAGGNQRRIRGALRASLEWVPGLHLWRRAHVHVEERQDEGVLLHPPRGAWLVGLLETTGASPRPRSTQPSSGRCTRWSRTPRRPGR